MSKCVGLVQSLQIGLNLFNLVQFLFISGTEWTESSGTLSSTRRLGNGIVIVDKDGGPDKLWIMGPDDSADFVFADGSIIPGDYPFDHR